MLCMKQVQRELRNTTAAVYHIAHNAQIKETTDWYVAMQGIAVYYLSLFSFFFVRSSHSRHHIDLFCTLSKLNTLAART